MTNLKSLKNVVAGEYHDCTITSQGVPWCWGYHSSGQLGNADGTFANQDKPVAVDTSTITSIKSLRFVANGSKSSCVITGTGVLWCWGDDGSAQLGNGSGTVANQTSPSAVDISNVSGEPKMVQVSIGETFAGALTAAGKAWFWGSDTYGTVGNGAGSSAEQAKPVALDASQL